MKLKPLLTTAALSIVCFLMYVPSLLAQGPDNPGGDPDIPIDGGLSLLIAAGVAYGAKKANTRRKKQLNTQYDLKKVE